MISNIQTRNDHPWVTARLVPAEMTIGAIQLMAGSVSLYLSFAEANLIVEALQKLIPAVEG